MSVQIEALSVNRVHNFKTKVEELVEGLTPRRLIWKAVKVDIEITSNESGGVRERRKILNISQERSIIEDRASSVIKQDGKVGIDNVERSRDANAVKFNRANKSSGDVSGEITKPTCNK